MRFALVQRNGIATVAAMKGSQLFVARPGKPMADTLQALLAAGPDVLKQAHSALLGGEEIDPEVTQYLPPFPLSGEGDLLWTEL